MKRNRLIRFAGIGVLAAGALLAQGPGMGPGMGMGMGGGMRRGPGMAGQPGQGGAMGQEFMATYLGLTDGQKAQAKTILENAQVAAKELMPQVQDIHQAIRDAVKAGASDATLQDLTNKQGALMGTLAFIRVKASAAVYAILTPEQKDKADKLPGLLMGMRGNRPGPPLP